MRAYLWLGAREGWRNQTEKLTIAGMGYAQLKTLRNDDTGIEFEERFYTDLHEPLSSELPRDAWCALINEIHKVILKATGKGRKVTYLL